MHDLKWRCRHSGVFQLDSAVQNACDGVESMGDTRHAAEVSTAEKRENVGEYLAGEGFGGGHGRESGIDGSQFMKNWWGGGRMAGYRGVGG